MLPAVQLGHAPLHGADRRAIVTPAKLMRVSLVCVFLFSVASAPAWAQPTPPAVKSAATSLTAVTIAAGPVVVVTGAGPLPVPAVGVLHSPERIYLDLDGVSTRALGARGEGELVTGVRVAQHSLEPLVARIVIDLKQPSRYAVNASQRASGRLEIALTSGAPPPAAAAPPSPVRAASPSPGLATPSRPKPRDSPARRYASQVERAVASAAELRGVLQDLDRKTAVQADRLQAAQAELNRLRLAIDGLRPPSTLSEAHDLLRSAAGFAATALGLASGSTTEVPGNASSAAAGALMMLERAEADLQAAASKVPRISL
jgi:hypothetical protein